MAPTLVLIEGRLSSPLLALRSGFSHFHSVDPFNPRGELELCLCSVAVPQNHLVQVLHNIEAGLRLSEFLSCVYPVGCFSAVHFTMVFSPLHIQSFHHWESSPHPNQPINSSYLLSHPFLPIFNIFTVSCTKHLVCLCPPCHLLTESRNRYRYKAQGHLQACAMYLSVLFI